VPVRFTVITPCFNAQAWIAATMASVLAQSVFADGRATLQYLVVDGASADATVAEAGKAAAGHGGVHVLSEPDEGMYDALAKGLARAEGDICCYINAGDLYHPRAFAVVAAIFEAGLARWLTGFHAVANVAGEVTDVRLPWRYRRAFFDCGLYGTLLPVVQQESTFWAGDLNRLVDLDRLRRCRLAGDFHLWRCFAAEEDLRIAAALLGVFRKVPGQLSADAEGYRAELRSLCRSPTVAERLLARHDAVRFRWLRTGRRRDRTHIVYDHRAGRWA
jgi:glycosyltransferase involved in cell wall biosynthesis